MDKQLKTFNCSDKITIHSFHGLANYQLVESALLKYMYWHHIHVITTLLAALSAGTKTVDLLNPLNSCLIQENGRFSMKVFSKCEINKYSAKLS